MNSNIETKIVFNLTFFCNTDNCSAGSKTTTSQLELPLQIVEFSDKVVTSYRYVAVSILPLPRLLDQ